MFGFLSPLLFNASIQELLAEVAATLRITEQKNLFKGVCVHHEAMEGQIFACPVKALASIDGIYPFSITTE